MLKRAPLTLILGLALAATLGFASSASAAATRYAAPNGTGSATSCLETAPCNLVDATTDASVQPDDVVILKPGNYTLTSQLFIGIGIEIKGTGAPPATTITATQTSGNPILISSADAAISDLRIIGHTTSAALVMTRGTAHRIFVSNDSSHACALGNVLMTDSICATSGVSAAGISANFAGGTHSLTLRNVTAVATDPGDGYGIYIAGSSSENISVNGSSVIASGSNVDIFAVREAGSTVSGTFDHSIYDSSQANSGTTVTPKGTGTGNLTGAPLFGDASSMDFRLKSGSAAIGAGAIDASTGTTDLIGVAHTEGGSIDAGALEFDETDPAAPSITSPSNGSTLTGAPIASGTSEPGSSVSLKLDGVQNALTVAGAETGTWSIALSGVAVGQHTLTATAEDFAGNASTPTSVTFTLVLPPAPVTDSTPPIVKFGKKPKSVVKPGKIKITFSANEPGTTFKCRLDAGKFKPCRSPYKKTVKNGKHKFQVIATDPAGNSSKPAQLKFRARFPLVDNR
jgi:hypothetical protein